MHRDTMELLNRIESLLTVAHHERRAIRAEIRTLSDTLKALKSAPKASFDWRHLMDSTLGRWLLTFFLGSTGILAWSEAIKVALQ